MAHNFKPGTLGAEAEFCEFEANLIGKAISSSQRCTSRPCHTHTKKTYGGKITKNMYMYKEMKLARG